MNTIDKEITGFFRMFFDGEPVSAIVVDTSRNEKDLRNSFIIGTASGEKYVLKLVDNDFTFPERIAVWQRAVTEYRRLGYYCPEIFADKSGSFPTVTYKGRKCVAYAEEFAKYKPAEDRSAENAEAAAYESYARDMWIMTAKVAGKRFDFSEYPSGYCLFETFCPSDKTYEVLEVAQEWKKAADRLPEIHCEQTERIWRLWDENRAELEKIYSRFPTSVFQADLNSTNILLDDDGKFVGVFDFNLCGRDVFLNYLIRELGDSDPEKERKLICDMLAAVREYYSFSQFEKDSVLMLYRCLKPLWYTHERFQKCGSDAEIKQVLDSIEHSLTADLDFKAYM